MTVDSRAQRFRWRATVYGMIGGDDGRNCRELFVSVYLSREGDLKNSRHKCGIAQAFSLQRFREPRILHRVVCKCGSPGTKATRSCVACLPVSAAFSPIVSELRFFRDEHRLDDSGEPEVEIFAGLVGEAPFGYFCRRGTMVRVPLPDRF